MNEKTWKYIAFSLAMLVVLVAFRWATGATSAPSPNPDLSRIVPTWTPTGLSASVASEPMGPVPQPTPTPVVCLRGEHRDYVRSVGLLVAKFSDTLILSASTPRILLAPIIQDLQATRREALFLNAPPCGSLARKMILDSMDLAISSMSAFLADPNSDASDQINDAAESLAKAVTYLTATIDQPELGLTPPAE